MDQCYVVTLFIVGQVLIVLIVSIKKSVVKGSGVYLLFCTEKKYCSEL